MRVRWRGWRGSAAVMGGRRPGGAGDPGMRGGAGFRAFPPADSEHWERGTVHDAVQELQRQHRLLGLCRAWKERSAGEVIRAALRSAGLLARLSIHGDADDRLRSEECPPDPCGRIMPSDVNSVGCQAASELRIVVRERRDAKLVREFP